MREVLIGAVLLDPFSHDSVHELRDIYLMSQGIQLVWDPSRLITLNPLANCWATQLRQIPGIEPAKQSIEVSRVFIVKSSIIGVCGHLYSIIERWDACMEQFFVDAKLLTIGTDIDIDGLCSEFAMVQYISSQ
jgi:hypothetical protein